ncbi:MAG TPA: RsiV family protein [Anaerolineales bacterium]|nr:RsiV family protein [Anaerolineales bacterium]
MPSARTFRIAGAFVLAGVFFVVTACASLLAASPRQMPTPAASVPPTGISAPLFQSVKLQSSPLEEQGQASAYKITAEVPVLVGKQDARINAFNALMLATVRSAADNFKQQVANLPAAPDAQTSTFDLRYNLVSPPGNILSLKFDIQTFLSGAAHPGTISRTVSFDLQEGRQLSLADLFASDVDFLTPISEYCIAELGNRDIGFEGFELGATADPGNYRNWNITSDGLMITFDEYQVAPYAAGPQTVVIPFRDLAQLIRPDGALAPYVQ